MKVMFLDESGDHNLRKINPVYPVFVLGGVIVDRAYARDVIEPEFRAFKKQFFGREDIVLHTVDLGRSEGDYAFLAHAPTRDEFYKALNSLLEKLEYKVIACVVKKPDLVAMHGANAADPYMYALDILVERFCMELGGTLDAGFICAERRNPNLDRDLLLAWEDLRTGGVGTGFATSTTIDERIVGFDLRDKKPNLVCMQLADLVITPIGRHIVGLPPKAHQVDWKIVERKLRTYKGTYRGAGLVVRP